MTMTPDEFLAAIKQVVTQYESANMKQPAAVPADHWQNVPSGTPQPGTPPPHPTDVWMEVAGVWRWQATPPEGCGAGVVMGASGIPNYSKEVITAAPDGTLPDQSQQLRDGDRHMWSTSTGWTVRYVGNPVNPQQDYINMGGNIGQYAAFRIFVDKTPGLIDQPFATQYAKWLVDQDRAAAEVEAADKPPEWGEAWKKSLCVLQVTPHGESCAEITRNFNKMVQSGQSPSLFMTYIFETSPTQLAFEPAFGRPLWAALSGAFISPGSMRAGLHLKEDEGYPGNCQIRGTDFVITRGDGSEFVWPLDCDFPDKGALSLHGGYAAYGTRY